MNRYGKLMFCEDQNQRNRKISESLKGKIRTKDHSNKIIESKRRNNTLNHSLSTRSLLRRKLNDYYQTGNNQTVNLSKSNGRGHKYGHVNGIFYRSSYELLFLQLCIKNGLNIISTETKHFRVRYVNQGNKHWYYPDFYIKEYGVVVEIKPKSLLEYGTNPIKFESALKQFRNFLIVTELELENEDRLMEYLRNKINKYFY
jgi:hypothetical protein